MSDAPLSLIETLRFEPEGGLVDIDLHEARMLRSAAALGLPFTREAFETACADVPRDEGRKRVRLELFPDGQIVLTHAPFAPLAEGAVWRAAIAGTRLSSTDPLLRHKTSRRDAYNTARAEFPADEAEEVLLLNEHGEVCEGTITSLFVPDDDGSLLTPPLSCGLLAGVLRGKLLAEGRAREALILPEMLAKRSFFLGNSLRGLIPARLVGISS